MALARLCSLLLGAYAATFQKDIKGVLAYSTISHLGLITLLLLLWVRRRLGRWAGTGTPKTAGTD